MNELGKLFAALADATRLRLLALMQQDEICVCHLQQILKTNQPKISRHLAYLRRAGLVEARRDGKWMHYKIRPQPKNAEGILRLAFARLANEPQIKRDLAARSKAACK